MIEATECLKSWSAGVLTYGTATEVELLEKLLQEVQRRAGQPGEYGVWSGETSGGDSGGMGQSSGVGGGGSNSSVLRA